MHQLRHEKFSGLLDAVKMLYLDLDMTQRQTKARMVGEAQ
jgi:hypothetical protein